MRLLTVGVIVLCAAVAWWVSGRLEKATVTKWRPASGEAASDPYYGLKQVASQIGLDLLVVDTLGTLPPARSTLVIDTPFWRLLPEHEAAVRAWVEAGGHLVLDVTYRDDALPEWTALRRSRAPRSDHIDQPADPSEEDAAEANAETGSADEDADDGVEEAIPPGSTGSADRSDEADPTAEGDDEDMVDDAEADADADHPGTVPTCPVVVHALTAGSTGDGAAGDGNAGGGAAIDPPELRLCGTWPGLGVLKVTGRGDSGWRLEAPWGAVARRVELGDGSVTVLLSSQPLGTRPATLGAHLRTLAAVQQWHPGATVWVLSGEERPPLWLWLWQQAGGVLLCLAAALALLTWRRTARFGPLLPAPDIARRSLGDQLRGTARFLSRARSPALLRAATEALRRDARRLLPGANQLDDTALWTAIARATRTDAAALQRACTLVTDHRRIPARPMADALMLIEHTRRALHAPRTA